ncbi:MAG: BlaI/MecI/CopY family transcriptional regulator [Natronomonas sp.]
MTRWTQIGPRERQILAILRTADGPQTGRDLLEAVRDDGDDIAYATVNSAVERLVEKGLVAREPSPEIGPRKFHYQFDAAPREFVPEIAHSVERVFGEEGLETLAVAIERESNSDPTNDE